MNEYQKLYSDIKADISKVVNINNLLWLIYIALLGVLLPHTAWAFKHFELTGSEWLAWALAFAFEAAVFAFTYQIKERIQRSHRLRQKEGETWPAYDWRKFSTAYVNISGLGLLFASGVSTLANFSHAVEFGRPMAVYAEYSLPPLLYEIAFGAILPIMSLLFARVLATTIDTEVERDETVDQLRRDTLVAKREASELRKQLDELRQRFAMFEQLYADDKAQRIKAVSKLWPDLPRASIAVVADTSPSYVSDVLNNGQGEQ